LPTDWPSACGPEHVGRSFWSLRCARERIERERIEQERIEQERIERERTGPILAVLSLHGRPPGGTGLPHRTGEAPGRPTLGETLAADRSPSQKIAPGAQCPLLAVDYPSADLPLI
jgi:hypothetical protein